MRKFLQDDVVRADLRLLRKLGIYPDPAGIRVAAPPLCFHSFDPPRWELEMKASRPSRDDRSGNSP